MAPRGAERMPAGVAGPALALALAGVIFVTDEKVGFHAAVSVLYPLVLVLGAGRSGRRGIHAWTALCLALPVISFISVHMPRPGVEAALRLTFALAVTGLTSALLLGRLRLREARDARDSSEETLRQFAELIPQILFRTDADGRVTYLNAWFTRLTGRSAEEALARQDWHEALHPEDRDRYLRLRTEAGTSPQRIHVRARDSAGQYRWLLLHRRPRADPVTGALVGWYGSCIDVDAEFRAAAEIRDLNARLERLAAQREDALRRSEHRFRALFDDLNIAFAEHDLSAAKPLVDAARDAGAASLAAHDAAHPGYIARCLAGIRLVGANRAMLQMLGYGEETGPLDPAWPAPRRGQVAQMLLVQLEALFHGRCHVSGSTTLPGREGRSIPVAFGLNLIPESCTALSTFIDISEQQAAHAAMLAAQSSLARAGRAATMGALSTSLAHELNQPVQALTTEIDTIRRWLQRDPPEMARALRTLDRLAGNGARIAAIMRRTRDQLVTGEAPAMPMDLRALLRETSGLLEGELSQRSARLRVDCTLDDPRVIAERVGLQQVLVNVLLNAAEAIAARPGGGPGLIRVLVGEAPGGMACIRIRDDGPGIAPQHLEKLFEPFFTTRAQGMGMGLHICRGIIERFGGTISAGNHAGGGAEVRFTLPRARARACAEDAA